MVVTPFALNWSSQSPLPGELNKFRFGVNCTTTSGTEWLDAARKAEALGFDTFIAQDHFGAQLAPLPALAAAAMVTTRLRLATLVLDNDFRHPALVAREVATLDVLSGGRAELGLGAGWLESDYHRTGIRLDPPSVRVARLQEAAQLSKALLAGETPVTFDGEHYRIRDLETLPRPIQKPRPPIMVGGRLRRTLSVAAREADIVSISLLDRPSADMPSPPSFAQKLEWVRSAAGSRFAALELHVNASVVSLTDRPGAAVESFAARTGMSVEAALASPGTLVGSVGAILEKLHAARQQFGLSYWVVHARSMDDLARVIARL
jgi:probable F420-dependent oxidoreductase